MGRCVRCGRCGAAGCDVPRGSGRDGLGTAASIAGRLRAVASSRRSSRRSWPSRARSRAVAGRRWRATTRRPRTRGASVARRPVRRARRPAAQAARGAVGERTRPLVMAARQPPHLDAGRRRELLRVRGIRHLDQRDAAGVGGGSDAQMPATAGSPVSSATSRNQPRRRARRTRSPRRAGRCGRRAGRWSTRMPRRPRARPTRGCSCSTKSMSSSAPRSSWRRRNSRTV